MKTVDLLNIDCIKTVMKDFPDKEIVDLYTSDLLSWVMGHVREENYCLLTVLNSINVIAVAVLLDLSAIIFCDGVIPTQDVIAKAEEEHIALFTSSKSSAQTAKEIYQYESLL